MQPHCNIKCEKHNCPLKNDLNRNENHVYLFLANYFAWNQIITYEKFSVSKEMSYYIYCFETKQYYPKARY